MNDEEFEAAVRALTLRVHKGTAERVEAEARKAQADADRDYYKMSTPGGKSGVCLVSEPAQEHSHCGVCGELATQPDPHNGGRGPLELCDDCFACEEEYLREAEAELATDLEDQIEFVPFDELQIDEDGNAYAADPGDDE